VKRQADKKLKLSMETLRNLTDPELRGAAGGATAACSGTSSGSGCTDTLVSDCHCASHATC